MIYLRDGLDSLIDAIIYFMGQWGRTILILFTLFSITVQYVSCGAHSAKRVL